jgi:hypothetical protein
MKWDSKCFEFFMGVCYSCRKASLSSSSGNNNHSDNLEVDLDKVEYINTVSSVTPLNAAICVNQFSSCSEEDTIADIYRCKQEAEAAAVVCCSSSVESEPPPQPPLDDDNVHLRNHHNHHHLQRRNHDSQNHNYYHSLGGYSKMANPIKTMVSKKRKRYTQDGFNLDLTCILFRKV